MQIIPVLDLMNGVVVRGRMGERSSYRPIVTPLAAGSDPVAVARGLQGLGPFPAFYVADLDAIMTGRPQWDALDRLAEALPEPEFWIDAGVRDVASIEAVLAHPRRVAVIGSETVASLDVVARFRDEPRAVLSLDHRGERFVGPPALAAAPDTWPARVVAMTLARVGSGAGPDEKRLAAIKALAGDGRAVFAAGGVRDAADLSRLEALGIAGALVASALHDGRLGGGADSPRP